MKPRLPERLARALLAEMASGNYLPSGKFISHREIMRKWQVSTPTAAKALNALVQHQVVEVRDRSGHYLTPDFRERALISLNRSGKDSAGFLPSRAGWQAKVSTSIRDASEIRRIAVVVVLPEEERSTKAKERVAGVSDFATCHTARGIFTAAKKLGVAIDYFVDNGSGDEGVEDSIVQQIIHSNAQGAIIIRRMFSAKIGDLASRLLSKWMPVVAVYDDCKFTRMVSVNFNNIGIGHTAASRFIEKGHTRIGVLLRPSHHGSYFWDRLRGCELAAEGHGDCAVVPVYVDETSAALECGCAKIRESGVSAMLVAGEELLAAIQPRLVRAGISIPEKLSVMICSSTPIVSGFSAPFDLFRLDFEEMGERSFEALLDFYRGETPFKTILVDPSVEVHGSVLPAKKGTAVRRKKRRTSSVKR